MKYNTIQQAGLGCTSIQFSVATYRVFDNERNKALVYHFGQKDAYDVGHVAKVSYICGILIFGF